MSTSVATEQRQFTALMRLFHWLTAAMVLTMLGIGVAMVASLAYYHRLESIHRPLGILILIVVMIRFVNRHYSTLPPFPATMSPQERSVASASELFLYALLVVQPLVGWGMLSAARYPIMLYGSVHLFPILPHNVILYAVLRKAHTVLAYLLFLTFLGHLGAVLFHTWVVRDGTFSRMAPWRVRPIYAMTPARNSGARDEPPPTTISQKEALMSERFSTQVVLIAGGTGGLGRAISAAFLEEGAAVIVTYRRQDEFDAFRNAVGAHALRLEGLNVDVTNEARVLQAVTAVVTKHGRLDVLTNAVGGYEAGRKLWEMDANVLDKMLSVNLLPGYVLSRAVVPVMLKQGHGVIVNVASTAAVDHVASAAAYAASKAAAVAMIDSLAADLKGTGVRANSILPSIIDTEANRKAMPNADFSKWPKPQEVARVILFLCGDDAELIHGASIQV